MEGSATFTTVLSSRIMNSAKHIAPRVHQRALASRIAARRAVKRSSARGGTRRPPAARAAGPARRPAARGRRGADALHPSVLFVLAALHVSALMQAVDDPAGRRYGHHEVRGDVLDAHL